MGKIVRTKSYVFSSLLVFVLFGMLLVGCGGNNKNPVGPGNTPEKTTLVLDEGFAWTNNDGVGIVFLSDTVINRVLYLSINSIASDDIWMVVQDDEYQVNNDSIITISKRGAGTYSIKNGNTLTLTIGGEERVFTKTSILYKPNDLVLWFNQAWATGDGRFDDGLMFLANKRVLKLDHGWANGGGWRIIEKGTYDVYGNSDDSPVKGPGIDFYWNSGVTETGTFTVNENGMWLTIPTGSSNRLLYTKRSGVNVNINL